MASKTEIAWTDSTFNPWIGCTKVSLACDNCYAERDFDLRRHVVSWGAGQPRKRTSAANWKTPVRWNAKPFAQCDACGWRGESPFAGMGDSCPSCKEEITPARRRVFCASLADVFDNEVDPQWRADLFALIEKTPNLDWLLLTKRIGNVAKMAPLSWIGGPIQHGPDPANIHGGWPANVWLGASVCNQTEADRDIPKLLAVPAAVRFLSVEPMLGPIDLTGIPISGSGHHEFDPIITANVLKRKKAYPRLPHINWVICGGESGQKARPISPDWARTLRDQCAAAGVPFLFKQWGEWIPMLGQSGGVPVKQKTTTPDGWVMGLAGVKVAGRALDGREHNEFPKAGA